MKTFWDNDHRSPLGALYLLFLTYIPNPKDVLGTWRNENTGKTHAWKSQRHNIHDSD